MIVVGLWTKGEAAGRASGASVMTYEIIAVFVWLSDWAREPLYMYYEKNTWFRQETACTRTRSGLDEASDRMIGTDRHRSWHRIGWEALRTRITVGMGQPHLSDRFPYSTHAYVSFSKSSLGGWVARKILWKCHIICPGNKWKSMLIWGTSPVRPCVPHTSHSSMTRLFIPPASASLRKKAIGCYF